MHFIRNLICLAILFVFSYILLANTPILHFDYFETKKELPKNDYPLKDTEEKCLEIETPAEKTSKKTPTNFAFYPAQQPAGIIGATSPNSPDNPSDNIFQIELDKVPHPNSEVWLTYELIGLADHHSVCRTINEQLAIGGYLIKKGENATQQEERIHPLWLEKGINTIRFSLPQPAPFYYQIKNLGLKIEEKAVDETISNQKQLIINQPFKAAYYNNMAYIKGLIMGEGYEKATVLVGGKKALVTNGAFEIIVPKPDKVDGLIWSTDVVVKYPDGTDLKKYVQFLKSSEADYGYPIASEIARIEKKISSHQTTAIDFEGISIQVDSGAFQQSQLLSITALRSIDLPPLNTGMVNVTKYATGFRSLPSNISFQREAHVYLAYDKEKIPAGFTEKDVRTFYYNKAAQQWEILYRDSVDLKKGAIISLTNQLGDMINGVIQVPESPTTQAYTPTSIKDMKAAPPNAEIVEIQPPTANNMGYANLTYPIKIPAGRNGMQPQVALEYSSGADNNSWCGVGWNLSMPAITIDTRWGVPRFNPDLETETYLLNGQQLSPVAHRDSLVARNTGTDSMKIFHPRVEGSFQKIMRYKTNSKDYWWETIDKTGTRYRYGGTPEKGFDETAVLTDEAGNIVHWALLEVEDLNGNKVRYNYVIQGDPGVAFTRESNGQNGCTGLDPAILCGRQIYISSIFYTLHDDNPGNYQIHFHRDRDLDDGSWQARKDIIIDARWGFKRVTADLLRKVVVQLNNIPIRSYELTYEEGAFFKTRLQKIGEYDANGELFYKHEMEYYEDVIDNDTYKPLADSVDWDTQEDNISGDLITSFVGYKDHASAISGNKGNNFNGGVAVTVGPNGSSSDKSFTAGGDFNYGEARTNGMLSLIDINGDGQPDKVFVEDKKLYYRPNLSSPETETEAIVYGGKHLIQGRKRYFHEKSKTVAFGFQLNGSATNVSGFLGYNRSKTKSFTKIYFSDVNGDQLVDIVDNGVVYFNRLENGHPVFESGSSDTPSPIEEGAAIDGSLIELNQEEADSIANEENPLHDVVKVWQAPFAGDITIDAPAQLMEDTTAERMEYRNADGVFVSIQHKENVLWKEDIASDDYTSHQIPETLADTLFPLTVKKGDRIYFRVESKRDGAYDQVNWNPTINYTSSITDASNEVVDTFEANGLSIYNYSSKEDFLLTGPSTIGLPIRGTVTIEGILEKPLLSDDVNVQIIHSQGDINTIIYDSLYVYDTASIHNIVLQGVSVDTNSVFSFKVNAETNVDWTTIKWKPSIFYTSTDDENYPIDDTLLITETEIELSDGTTETRKDTLLKFHPVVDYSIYAEPIKYSASYSLNFGQLLIRPKLTFKPDVVVNGEITFSVKKGGRLLPTNDSTIPLTIQNNTIEGQIPLLTTTATSNEAIFFEYFTSDRELAFGIDKCEVTVTGITYPASLYTVNDSHQDSIIFGPKYRHWGQFVYKGISGGDSLPIIEASLMLDPALMEEANTDTSTPVDETTVEDRLSGAYQPAKSQFVMMLPFAEECAYKGYDNLTYVRAANYSSSRLGDDDPVLANPIPIAEDGQSIRGIEKMSESIGNSFSLGASVGPEGIGFGASGSYSYTIGNSKVMTDFLDMNGDRYPDLVGKNKIQYTRANGGLEESSLPQDFLDPIHKTKNSTFGITRGGSYVFSEKQADNNPKKFKLVVSQNSAGVTGNIGLGKETTKEDDEWFSLQDINADGLPDKVFAGGNVALNLGYRFAPKEQWGFKRVKDGSSNSYSLGLGVNFVHGSIQAGIGIAGSDNISNYSLLDINGDGLIDRVFDRDTFINGIIPQDRPINIHLNTGNGFSPGYIDWIGANKISNGTSKSESANAAATFCVNFLGFRVCVNPSASVGQNASREKISIQDVNGDGFPDYLRSDEDDKLTVSLSTIARTNQLKTIHRPLGASFTLDYQRVGNTYDMPNSVWTLSSVLLHDGFEGDGADEMLTTFEYADGQYDRHEREFYGFKTLKIHQHDTENDTATYRTNIQTFINDNYYEKGLLVSDILQNGGDSLYTETINSYKLLDLEAGLELDTIFRKRDNGAAFPALVMETQNFYEGLSEVGKSTHKTYDYDLLGNVTTYTDTGEPDIAADDLKATIAYHNIDTTYIVGIPSEITVTSNGTTYRKRNNQIDDKGNVIEIRQMLEDGSAADFSMTYYPNGNLQTLTRPTNHNGERLSFTYEYDTEVSVYPTKVSDSYGYSSTAVYDLGFGQVIESRDMNNQPTAYELDAVGRIVKVTGPYEFDETNANAYTIKFVYHPDAEVPWALTQHFDLEHPDNPIETATFTDGIGRVIQIKKDGDIFNDPASEDTEQMIVSGRVLFDAFGRTISSRYPVVEDLGSQGVFNLSANGVVPTTMTYDVLDRTLSTTLPDGAVTSMVYAFGIPRADNSPMMFFTKVTDANGITKDSYTDVRGRLVATQDTDSEEIWADFEYNAINELIIARDDQNNEIVSEYDWLGRRTARIHPDAGLCTYKYDLASNLIEKQTANIRVEDDTKAITYHYDRERLTDIIYPFNAQNNVNYTYGDIDNPDDVEANSLGRIKTQSDATGQQQFFYGPLGEITKNIRLINIASGIGRSYTTRWTYDTWNRVQEIVYPDGELLTYDYNRGGKLARLSGSKVEIDYNYVTKVGYDKFEDRVYMAYGNGTYSTYNYEEDRRRLQTMQTYTPEFGGRTIMNCAYQYDAVTNITQIENMADAPASYQLGGATKYTFEYDDLYRLTHAEGEWTHHRGASTYTLDMAYNRVHDIETKNQFHQLHWNDRPNPELGEGSYQLNYTYDNPDQPHTATTIGFRPYHYDPNGNLTQIQGVGWWLPTQHLKWDEEDRLMETFEDTDANRPNRYVYDADDIRTYKYKNLLQQVFINGELVTVSDDIGFDYTVYVNPYMVITGGRYTKHIFIEGQRIASKLGVIGEGQPDGNWGNWDQWDSWNAWDNWANREDWDNWDEWANWYSQADWLNPLEDLQYYFHSDHLGSSTYITDFHGFVHQHLEYFPFGDIFVEQHKTNNGFNPYLTPYLFNGKEMDEETGWYYYGARYLMPRESRWLSVDPMAEKYPSYSPYNYTLNNPVVYVDPDGEDIWEFRNGFKSGVMNGVEDLKEGVKYAFIHPIKTVKAVGIAIWNYDETAGLIKESLNASYQKFNTGDSQAKGEVSGELSVAIAEAIIGTKGATKLIKATKLSKLKNIKLLSPKKISIDDLLKNAKPGKKTKGRTTQHIKVGGYDQALKDFNAFSPSDVKKINGGKVGTLDNGQKIIVRRLSSDGRPTLEIQSGQKRIKVRYDE